MITDEDRRFMGLALTEAAKGRPSPNPHVGAVVVRQGAVVGVGHHPKAGLGHAEPNALRAAGEAARGATLYVTLEPCNHTGRTPPCTEAILAAGIRRVVIASRDPHPHVPMSTERLRAGGVEVEHGCRTEEGDLLIADFAKHIRTGLPFVTAKAALTLDGKMATRTGSSKWITGPEARAEAHRMRDASDAVMVGVGTVLADDPALTVRLVEGQSPLRVVLDTALRTPRGAQLLSDEAPTLIFHAPDAPEAAQRALREAGAELCAVPAEAEGGLSLPAVLAELGRRGCVRLLVEGGPRLHGALFRQGQVDRVAAFIAPALVGDAAAPAFVDGLGITEMSAALRLASPRVRQLGDDLLVVGELAPGARTEE